MDHIYELCIQKIGHTVSIVHLAVGGVFSQVKNNFLHKN